MTITVNESYRLKRLAALVKGKKRVLDIGWAQQPNRYLQNSEVVGLDIKNAETPPNYSSCIVGDSTRLIAAGELFDAVIAGELIEHLEDPIAFLQACHTLLQAGGTLVVSTPNPHSLIEYLLTIFLSRKYFYATDHLMLFPQRWLIRMLEFSGFRKVQLYSGGFPVPGIGLVPCPRVLCHQTIAVAIKKDQHA